MAKSLPEYADWLDERRLMWPKPPSIVPAHATPYTKPLKGIQAVTWSVYGVLLRISDGQLLFKHPELARMQVAMEKTIEEFKMWNSMPRKPGAPWQQLYEQYTRLVDDQQMSGTQRKGDYPEVDSSSLWRKLLSRLGEKNYDYDMSLYGDPEELSDKVAYFFHSSLQGVEASPNAREALLAVSQTHLRQTLLANAQPFTLVQLLRALKKQGTLPAPGELFAFDCMTLSFQEGIRKPSRTFYQRCVKKFEEHGIAPDQILHVGCRVRDDLAVAKTLGLRTALYAADKVSMRAKKEDMKNPDHRPDRLLTDLIQIREVLGID